MLAPYVWDCPLPLDLASMQNAADGILGTHDFTSFAAADPDLVTRESESDSESAPHETGKTAVRAIRISSWTLKDGLLIYRVTGTGFLHHMVRNLVGTFVDIGAGRRTADSIPGILAARSRSAAGPTAPARGLFLVEVEY
jgi:tRNA pseudouridine38-40 synthase